MSDWIEHDGKKYFEESYVQLANNNAERLRTENATLQTQLMDAREALARADMECDQRRLADSEMWQAKIDQANRMQPNDPTYCKNCGHVSLKADERLAAASALKGALSAIADNAESSYHELRHFIDNNVPDWIRGDDGPAYPFLRIAKAARAALEGK